jgi:hypothetical protein
MQRLPAIIFAALVVVGTSRTARAQSSDRVEPHAGAWGAELQPFATGASLLYFPKSSSAWLLGADVSYTHSNRPQAVSSLSTNNLTFVRGQLGHRWYRGSDMHLRTLYGLGAMGSLGNTDNGPFNDRQWSAGPYGELGGVWFFTPHLSLGATGQAQVLFGQDRSTGGGVTSTGDVITSTSTAHTISISATAVRMTAAVYF